MAGWGRVVLTSCSILLAAGCLPSSEDMPPPKSEQSAVNWVELRDPDPSVRRKACEHLREANPATVSALVEMLRDPDPSVRHEAGGGLLNSRELSKIPALIAALQSSDPTLRYEAARALGRIGRDPYGGSDVRPATAALRKALADPVERIRVCAAWALSQQDEDELQAMEILASGLDSGDEVVLETALEGLAQYSDRSPRFFVKRMPVTVVPALLHILQGGNRRCKGEAASLLGSCGDSSGPVIVGLSTELDDPDEGMRVAAAFSLSELPGANTPEQVFPVLCSYMDAHHEGLERQKTCWALGRLNRFPPCVVEALTRHLSDEDRDDQFAVACLLSLHPRSSVATIERILVGRLRRGSSPFRPR